jgi:cobalt-zinc-cadmium efflux system membrane fusion protein
VVVALLITGFWAAHWLGREDGDEVVESGATAEDDALPTRVTLSDHKVEAAGIHSTPAARRMLQATHVVPGKVDYDETVHVELRSPVASLIVDVLVRPGQVVQRGERLAVLSSPEVGLARTEVEHGTAELRLAQMNQQWKQQTYDNLLDVLDRLSGKPPIADLEAEFDQRPLGASRDRLISAYSQFLLAVTVTDRTASLGERGVISGRLAEERASQREVAAARFRATCESLRHEGRLEVARADAEVDAQRHELAVSRERLGLLLGPLSEQANAQTLAQFDVRSPLDGRVEEVQAVASNRAEQGEQLLTVADASRLWLSAQIYQRDWGSLEAAAGQTLKFSVPALPDEIFTARTSFASGAVSPVTRSIQLVAEIDNSAERLRPGMFAWVTVPVARAQDVLAVPASALQRHDGKSFVFVADRPNSFRRVDVTTGIETPEWIAVLEGLEAGQPVVDHGAFALKSELLLEREPE